VAVRRRTVPALVAPLLALAATGCAPATPRAAPGRDGRAIAPSDPSAEGGRFVAGAGGRSRLLVRTRDVVTGRHVVRFEQWRAVLVTTPEPSVSVEVDMHSLRTSSETVEAFLKNDLLEVDRYPKATLVGKLSANGDAGEYVVDATLVLHGVEKQIRFKARLTRRPTSYRFFAIFELSRTDFDIRRPDAADGWIDRDVIVTIDADGAPEPVTADDANRPRAH
jgi:polyisoprenoid-binding protein YceI